MREGVICEGEGVRVACVRVACVRVACICDGECARVTWLRMREEKGG